MKKQEGCGNDRASGRFHPVEPSRWPMTGMPRVPDRRKSLEVPGVQVHRCITRTATAPMITIGEAPSGEEHQPDPDRSSQAAATTRRCRRSDT